MIAILCPTRKHFDRFIDWLDVENPVCITEETDMIGRTFSGYIFLRDTDKKLQSLIKSRTIYE